MDFKNKYLKYKKKYMELKHISIFSKKTQVGSGIAEGYCEICGAPFRSFNISGKLFKFKNTHKKYFDIIKKKEPKIFNNIVQNSLDKETFIRELEESKVLSDDIIDKISDQVVELKDKKYNWLNDLVFLHPTGKIIKVKDDLTASSKFVDKNYKLNPFYVDENKYKYEYVGTPMGEGISIHNDCYKLLKSKIGEFNIFNFYRKIKKIYYFRMDPFNNDKINKTVMKCQKQLYSWFNYFYNNIEYVLESPLNNSKNKNRILKIKNIYSLKNNKLESYNNKNINNKKKKDRPSPSESATKFKLGTKKKGNDGNMWIIVENKNGVKRWRKIK